MNLYLLGSSSEYCIMIIYLLKCIRILYLNFKVQDSYIHYLLVLIFIKSDSNQNLLPFYDMGTSQKDAKSNGLKDLFVMPLISILILSWIISLIFLCDYQKRIWRLELGTGKGEKQKQGLQVFVY